MRRVKRFLLLEEFQEDAVIQDSSMGEYNAKVNPSTDTVIVKEFW